MGRGLTDMAKVRPRPAPTGARPEPSPAAVPSLHL